MQYLLLIYHRESDWGALTEPERQNVYREYRELSEEWQKSGKCLRGDELQPVATATTLRVRNGKRSVTDGPFAETREQLAGYYLVEARDLDEALDMAARIPSAQMGSIEIRPLAQG